MPKHKQGQTKLSEEKRSVYKQKVLTNCNKVV